MKSVLSGYILCALAILTGCNAPETPRPQQPVTQAPAPRLTQTAGEALTIAAGAQDTLAFTFSVRSGFHVQANPVPHAYLIPATLKADSTNYFTPQSPLYPAGHTYVLTGSTDSLSVYDGTFQIPVPVTASADAPAGNYTLNGTFRFQACDDTTCFAPRTITVTHDILVEE